MGITDKAMNMASALAVKTVTRLDDWQNELTQLGQAGLDRIKGNVPAGVTILSDDYLENMYYGGGLEARIVDLPVDHGTRKGYIIRGPKAGEDDEQPEWTPETTPDQKQLGDEVHAEWRRLDAWGKLMSGSKMGRLYGLAAVYIIAKDGGEQDTPLNVEHLSQVISLKVLDGQEFQKHTIYMDPAEENFGEVETYRLTTNIPGLMGGVIHESRLVVFGGAETSDRAKRGVLNYRDFSVLQRVYDALQRFDSNWRSADAMMVDASQGVLKMEGLAEVVAGKLKGVVNTRCQALNLGRASSRIMPIDTSESYEYVDRSFQGIPDMLTAGTFYVAAQLGWPSTVLFGRSPQGMNATGDSDADIWNAIVEFWREMDFRPQAEELLYVISKGADGWAIGFPALDQETAQEEAERRKTIAETDAIYVQAEILQPEQVALARFGGGGYSDTAPSVDADALQALLDMDNTRVTDPVTFTPEPAEETKDVVTDPKLAADPKAAYNGAQVSELKETVKSVAAGELPRDSGVEIVLVGYPVDRETAEKIIGSAGQGFETKKAAPPAFGQPPVTPPAEEDDEEDDNEGQDNQE